MDDIIGFGQADADAITRLIDKTGGTGAFPTYTYDATKLVLAYSTSGVPARSGTTLGEADVAVKYLGISSGRVILDAGYNIRAYNLSSTAVAASKYILLLRLGDVCIVIWEEC